MQGTHYPLVSLDNGRLVGPCAAAFAEQAKAHPELQALLSGAVAGQVELLGVEAGLDQQDAFWAKPTGLLASSVGGLLTAAMVEAVRHKGAPILRRGDQLIYNLFQPPVPSSPALKVLASHLHQQRTGRPLTGDRNVAGHHGLPVRLRALLRRQVPSHPEASR